MQDSFSAGAHGEGEKRLCCVVLPGEAKAGTDSWGKPGLILRVRDDLLGGGVVVLKPL